MLTTPDCILGYTHAQLQHAFTPTQLQDLLAGLAPEHQLSCQGSTFNAETGEHEPSGCGPHGLVVPSAALPEALSP